MPVKIKHTIVSLLLMSVFCCNGVLNFYMSISSYMQIPLIEFVNDISTEEEGTKEEKSEKKIFETDIADHYFHINPSSSLLPLMHTPYSMVRIRPAFLKVYTPPPNYLV